MTDALVEVGGQAVAYGLVALLVLALSRLSDPARRRRWLLELEHLFASFDAHANPIDRENVRRRLVDARYEARRG